MVLINVRGVDVDFPFTPYECQVTYMEKVIECLQEVSVTFIFGDAPSITPPFLSQLICGDLFWTELVILG